MVSVAIIGAGPAGLVSAKECMEHGMDVTIYERSSCVGGVWGSGSSGMTWESLKTNISKYSCCYSDFAWQNTISEFPTAQEVNEYLSRYAEHHDILKHIKFNSSVSSLGYSSDTKSALRISLETPQNEIDFDKVIVASGFFSRERYPFDNVEPVRSAFDGAVLHAKSYRNAQRFSGQNVAVVGGAFGGVDIAASVAEYAAKVVHLFRTPSFIIPRYPLGGRIPFDLMSGNRDQEDASASVHLSERYKRANGWLCTLTEQNNLHGSLYVDPLSCKPPRVAISDTYLNLVNSGKIVPQRMDESGIVGYKKNKILVEGSAPIHADSMVFCTGYNHGLGFLSQDIKDTLEYRGDDNFLPMLAYQSTFHPDLPNLGFVGAYRGPYFSVMELQARALSKIFLGEVNVSEHSKEVSSHLAQMGELRNAIEKPQFPYRHISMGDSLAELCGIVPSEGDVPIDIFENFRGSAVVPAHYRLCGEGACREYAIQSIRQLPR